MFTQRRTISTAASIPAFSIAGNSKGADMPSLSDLCAAASETSRPCPPHDLHAPQHIPAQPIPTTEAYASVIPGVSFIATKNATVATAYNAQTQVYTDTLFNEQMRLAQKLDNFLDNVYATVENPTSAQLRDYSNWSAVKSLTIRSELMKLQIGGKTDLPLSKTQYANLSSQLKGLDLSDMSNTEVNKIIENLLHPDKRSYLDALKVFKATGMADSCIQPAKKGQLQEYLKSVDLSKITADQFKYIEDNFLEKIEVHHRTSHSTDPSQQYNIDNLDVLNTTQHDAKHTDPATGKINYRMKLSEASRDRDGELRASNRDRVLKENLSGLGLAVAIGMGTGFTIGFVVSLAQNGLNPNSLKYAVAAGAKQSISSAPMAVGGYAIARTIGSFAGKVLTSHVTSLVGANVAEDTLQKLSEICNMGAAGSLVIFAFSTYEFARLKRAGYSTKESLLRTGKSAALSTSILLISMGAVWAGCPGIAVSVVSGIIITGYQVFRIQQSKHLSRDITLYTIELCRPKFALA